MSTVPRDVILLVIGIAVPFIITLFLQPLVEDRAYGLVVRLSSRFTIRRKLSLTGTWQSVWSHEGAALSTKDQFEVNLHEINGRIAGQFKWKDSDYRILARRLTDSYITGTYENIYSGNTYHGAFQLRVLPNGQVMGGQWMGFNSSGTIISGPWQWRRNNKRYPFEYDAKQATGAT